jgi:hypothetical protein
MMMAQSHQPQPNDEPDQHPDYGTMAETLEIVARELAERAEAERDKALARQSRRLFELAAAIRSDLAE